LYSQTIEYNVDDDDDDDDDDAVSPVLVGVTCSKKILRFRHFKSDRGEICRDCSSHNYSVTYRL